ncbi:hypothetical protein [Sporosarcina aquimarina]|uniref:hypothetical protein n=1 Tax=Sporosarcina aquimarina TaxID=114975 RepID=UPI001C8D12EC|nr:hypothetical protein [Sporosarcina aquimarina]MBY0224106.1 hypothetical protein [Sporosarcina aquimarina]
MSESYLTLKQLVELVDIPENSCKRYLQEHEQFLNYRKVHNRFQIHVSAVDTLKTIRRLYGEGMRKEGVDEYLNSSGVPVTITVDSEEGKDLISINQELQEMKKMMEMQVQFNQRIAQQMEADKKEMKEAFQQEIQELKTIINRQESEKVSQLRISMEESRKAVDKATATAEALAESLEAEKNKGFFSRLFGK